MTEPSKSATASALTDAARRYGTWGLVAAVILVHLAIAAQSVSPMYLFDEVGYLAGANVIGGQGVGWSLCGSSYSVGYSAALAPLWWLPIQPVSVYQIAAYVSAALGAAVMWPASALARRFGATRGVALAIGALVSLVPARALLDNYVIAENPLTLLVACSAVLAWRVADQGRLRDAFAFGITTGLAAAVHARAIPLVAVAVAWVIVRWVVRESSARAMAATAVPAILLSVGGFIAQQAMGATLFASDDRVGDLIGGVTPAGIAKVVLGQGFTQVVSWSLLTVLGVLACAKFARRAVRSHGRVGLASAWWWLGAMAVAQTAFIVAVLAASSDLGTRFDIPIFGRYLDPFVVPIAVLGATTLWTQASRRLPTVALIVSAAALAGYGSLVLPGISADAKWIPFAVPGLEPFLSPSTADHRLELALAGAAGLVVCLLLWLSRRWAKVGLTAALLVATTATLMTDAFRVDPFESGVRAPSTITAFVKANSEQPVTFAADLLPCADRNKLQFELAGTAVIVPAGGDYGDGFVVGPGEWPEAEAEGRVRVPLTLWQSTAVWTAPQ